MSRSRWTAGCACGVLVASLAACSLPAAGTHEVLRVSQHGDFSLNGAAVAHDGLQQALTAERERVGKLVLELHPDLLENTSVLKYVAQQSKAAHVVLAYTHDLTAEQVRAQTR